jgi:hypothetical protein
MNITLNLEKYYQKFLKFKKISKEYEENEDTDEVLNFLQYCSTDIHHITLDDLEHGDTLLVYPVGCGMYSDIKWKDFQIWKVYKIEKCFHGPIQPFMSLSFHFLEFMNVKMFTKSDEIESDNKETFGLYSYYDYDTSNTFENFLYRGSSEIIGIKITNETENE